MISVGSSWNCEYSVDDDRRTTAVFKYMLSSCAWDPLLINLQGKQGTSTRGEKFLICYLSRPKYKLLVHPVTIA